MERKQMVNINPNMSFEYKWTKYCNLKDGNCQMR